MDAHSVFLSFWIIFAISPSLRENTAAYETKGHGEPKDLFDSLDSDHDSHSVWVPDESSTKCTQDSCSQRSEDFAEVLIQDLQSAIKKAADDLANPNHYPAHHNPRDEEEFDFIVVGAGSAGAVVANRLTEVSGWRVLLVEAGGDPTPSSEIPALFGTLYFTDVDWQYRSEPEENNCLGMVNSSCVLSRGKVLGGSSTINYMMYSRGNAKDYDSWATSGNKGWSYEEVLPYFKKSEDMRAAEVLAMDDAEKYHGRGGFLKLNSWPNSTSKSNLIDGLKSGMEELGYYFNPDSNGGSQAGFTRMPGTLEDGKRCSTAKAFLSSIKERKNLKVAKNSLVTKILFRKDTSEVQGIELINKDGKRVVVRTKKEVILSAGAINSPQLLMLSGIGPKQHLDNFKIPLIKDLPVGKNLQDHPLMTSLAITVNYCLPASPSLHDSIFDFLMERPNSLSILGETFGYAGFINMEKGVDYPDVELLPMAIGKNEKQTVSGLLRSFGFKEDIINEFVKLNENYCIIIMFSSLLREFSRGEILLRSSDPNTKPKLVSGYLTDSRDIDIFLKTYDFISDLVQTQGMKELNAKMHEIRLSNCEIYPFSSNLYRECSLRHLTVTTNHISGTCKMGPSEDPEAVVDPTLRVVGVKGLRVVDASVMPTIVSGNINAATIMIAEKASDLIKDYWLT